MSVDDDTTGGPAAERELLAGVRCVYSFAEFQSPEKLAASFYQHTTNSPCAGGPVFLLHSPRKTGVSRLAVSSLWR